MNSTLEAVVASARTHKNPETRVISREGTLPLGCVIRQGDVMLTRHSLDYAVTGMLTDDMQLAPGASVGSRHVLRAGDLRVYARTGGVLVGPLVVAPNGFYLEHPTHADVDCRLPGVYEVSYPRDFAAEGIARRRD